MISKTACCGFYAELWGVTLLARDGRTQRLPGGGEPNSDGQAAGTVPDTSKYISDKRVRFPVAESRACLALETDGGANENLHSCSYVTDTYRRVTTPAQLGVGRLCLGPPLGV